MSSSSATRADRSCSDAPIPCTSSGSDSSSRTVIRGFSDACGSWNTIWNRRRIRRMSSPASRNRSTPSNTIEPESGSTMRSTHRAVVVLPQPDSPTRLNVSPAVDRERHIRDGLHRAGRAMEELTAQRGTS